MNEAKELKLQGTGWLASFIVTSVFAAALAMYWIQILVRNLIGGFWDELKSDFFGFIFSYTWGFNTFVGLVRDSLVFLLIIAVPILLYREFLKRNRDYDFRGSGPWQRLCWTLLLLAVLSLVVYLASVWMVARDFNQGFVGMSSVSQWQITAGVFWYLLVLSLFVATFFVSAKGKVVVQSKSRLTPATYVFVVLSVGFFIAGRAFMNEPPASDEILQKFDFMRTTPESVGRFELCATWDVNLEISRNLSADTSTASLINLALEEKKVVDLILLESLYNLQLKDTSWREAYELAAIVRLGTNKSDAVKFIPQSEIERLSSFAGSLTLEELSELSSRYLDLMFLRCPLGPNP